MYNFCVSYTKEELHLLFFCSHLKRDVKVFPQWIVSDMYFQAFVLVFWTTKNFRQDIWLPFCFPPAASTCLDQMKFKLRESQIWLHVWLYRVPAIPTRLTLFSQTVCCLYLNIIDNVLKRPSLLYDTFPLQWHEEFLILFFQITVQAVRSGDRSSHSVGSSLSELLVWQFRIQNFPRCNSLVRECTVLLE